MNSKERILFLLALTGLAMSLVMTSLSAYIRLAESSIGCEPWPDCQAQHFNVDDQPGIAIAATDDNKGLRVLHRFMASTFGFVAMLLVILNLWYRKLLNFTPILSVICFALTMLLAMVGMVTPDIFHPAVTFINLTAGMLTTAVLWLLVLTINRLKINRLRISNPEHVNSEVQPGYSTVTRLNLINVWLVIAVIASGAWVSANFASGACTDAMGCLRSENLVDAFDLTREIQLSQGALLLDEVQSTISGAHHLLSTLVFVSLIVGSYLGFRTAPMASVAIAGITVGLIFLGLIDSGVIGGGQSTLLSAWMHNFWSMLLLLAVIYNRENLK